MLGAIGKLYVFTMLSMLSLLILYSLWSSTTSAAGSSRDLQYAILIDAGSSGTRVHVYTYRPAPDSNSYPEIQLPSQEKRITPGLSFFAPTGVGAGESLGSLFSFAREQVPEHLHSQTPLFVFATAGLRMLPQNQKQAVLDSVRDTCSASGFRFQAAWARVLPGEKEGLYAWVAYNYAAGTLQALAAEAEGVEYGGKVFPPPLGSTWGVLELGGASMQMTYLPHAPATLDDEFASHLALPGLGPTTTLYTHSFLGYGADMAFRNASSLKDASGNNPCLPKGYKHGSDPPGTGNFTGCLRLMSTMLPPNPVCKHSLCSIGGEYLPPLTGTFLATENFFYTAMRLGMKHGINTTGVPRLPNHPGNHHPGHRGADTTNKEGADTPSTAQDKSKTGKTGGDQQTPAGTDSATKEGEGTGQSTSRGKAAGDKDAAAGKGSDGKGVKDKDEDVDVDSDAGDEDEGDVDEDGNRRKAMGGRSLLDVVHVAGSSKGGVGRDARARRVSRRNAWGPKQKNHVPGQKTVAGTHTRGADGKGKAGVNQRLKLKPGKAVLPGMPGSAAAAAALVMPRRSAAATGEDTSTATASPSPTPTTQSLGGAQEVGLKMASVADVFKAGVHFCSQPWSQLEAQMVEERGIPKEYVIKTCFSSAYTYWLLRHALQFTDEDKRLLFSNMVQALPDGAPKEVNWVLGALIAQIVNGRAFRNPDGNGHGHGPAHHEAAPSKAISSWAYAIIFVVLGALIVSLSWAILSMLGWVKAPAVWHRMMGYGDTATDEEKAGLVGVGAETRGSVSGGLADRAGGEGAKSWWSRTFGSGETAYSAVGAPRGGDGMVEVTEIKRG